MFELFHEISNPASAKVRAYIVEHDLLGAVRFRNLFYEEVQADFRARGGVMAPALWNGETLIEGVDKIFACLSAHQDVGRNF